MTTTRRSFLKASSALAAAFGLDCTGLPTARATSGAAEGGVEFSYSHLEILGTSLDLTVIAPDAAVADAAERAVLEEIERLRQLLSAYDPTSELAKVNAAQPRTPVRASAELLEVLGQYDRWQQRTAGAFSGRLGNLAALWRRAERENRLPSDEAVAAAVAQLAVPGWRVDVASKTVERLSGEKINIDALGKGYIIDKAVEAARTKVSGVAGILLNIGGDIRVWNATASSAPLAWPVGVQDPANKADNAAPLTVVLLDDRAVATSGSYERYYAIGGKRYSHILDPRDGKPATAAVSATVVAADTATANALATAVCALAPEEGLRLIQETAGAECLIVTPEGRQFRSAGFARLEAPATRKTAGVPVQNVSLLAAAGMAWPKGYQVTVDIDLVRRGPKPYVYCWILDARGAHVKTIAAWGNERKYIKSMREWSKIGPDPELVKAVARATRKAGKYTLAWDGTDQKGKTMPMGTYTVCLEVVGEKRFYGFKAAKIVCGKAAASAKLEASMAFAEAPIAYGPAAAEEQ